MTPSTAGFSEYFRGQILGPADADYESRRFCDNGLFDRRPVLIARCLSVADVVEAVRHARERDLEIAVRAGGHHTAGTSTTDGVLIDLSLMRGTRASAQTQTMWLQGGCLMGDVQAEAGRVGLGAVTGVSSLVGAGLLLNGGLGYLAQEHGWGCQNIVSAEVVTADGEVVTASAQSHPDLFHGIRGAASNFGVVTSMEIALHPVPRTILAGGMMWSGDDEQVARILKGLRDFQAQSSDQVAMYAALDVGTSTDGRPEHMRGKRVIDFIVCHVGEPSAAEREIAELRAAFPPDVDGIEPMTFQHLHFALDEAYGAWDGTPQTEDEELVSLLSDDLIDALVADGDAQREDPADPVAYRSINLYPENHALSRAPDFPTAIDVRGPNHWALHPRVVYADAANTAAHAEWVQSIVRKAHDAGVSDGSAGGANFVTTADAGRGRDLFGGQYDTLAAIKRTWDPDNVFNRRAGFLVGA